MFMGIAKSYGLNPMKREIHFVKRKHKQADGTWIEVGSSIVGYEVYLKRAERTGKLDGWKCWIEKDQMGEKAIIEIKRKDQSMPIRWEVYRKEFDTEKSTWGKMPTFMLKKVAIAQGFRLAFPDDLGGMPYIPEEMPHDKGGGVSEALPQEEVVETPVEDVPKTPAEGPKVAAAGQVTQIQIIMKNRGITEREKILADLTEFCGRVIKSSKELSFSEANDFIKASGEHEISPP